MHCGRETPIDRIAEFYDPISRLERDFARTEIKESEGKSQSHGRCHSTLLVVHPPCVVAACGSTL